MSLCPNCHTAGAYVGIIQVECPSRKCRHFSSKVAPPVKSAHLLVVPEGRKHQLTFDGITSEWVYGTPLVTIIEILEKNEIEELEIEVEEGVYSALISGKYKVADLRATWVR